MSINLNAEMNRMLAQMKAMEQAASLDKAQPTNLAAPAAKESEPPAFGSLLKTAVDNINGLSKESSRLSEAYIKGDPNVDITRVMVASQKSSIATTAMIQVRNKVVESYKEIMNMPV